MWRPEQREGPGHPEGYPGPSRLSTTPLVALARWNRKAVRLASEGGEGRTALSAMYGICEDRDIGHMAHFLRCASKGRDYTNRLQRGARPAADASSKRPRCGEDGSAARPRRNTRAQLTARTGAAASAEWHIFYNADKRAGTPRSLQELVEEGSVRVSV
jgi:hypothetical protein